MRMAGVVDRVPECSREASRSEDDDQAVARLDPERPAPDRLLEVTQAVEVACARGRIDEAAVRRPHLDETELGDVTRDGRLHGLVTGLAQGVGELGLGRDLTLANQAQDRALALAAVCGHG